MNNKIKEQEDIINLLLLSINLYVSLLYSLLSMSPLSSLLAIVVVITRCRPPFGPFQAGLTILFSSVAVSVAPVLALPDIFVPVIVVPVDVVVITMLASFVGYTKPG